MTIKAKLRPCAVALACAFALSPAHTWSQEAAIETITITGSRLALDTQKVAAAVTVLEEHEIRQSGAVQITDLLRGLPGVSIAQSGSIGGLTEIRLRGAESNHLLVLIDGVIANDISQGNLIDLAHLTSAGVKRIELLRGPQSAIWGSGAVAGVLSITTTSANDNQDARPQVSGDIGKGNRRTERVAVQARSTVNNTRINVFMQHFDSEGFNVSRQGEENDGYRNTTLGLGVQHELSAAHRFSADIRYVDYRNEFDAVDFMTTGLPVDADNVTRGEQFNASANWLFTPSNSDYSSQLFIAYRSDQNENFAEGAVTGAGEGRRIQANWVHRYAWRQQQFAFGTEYMQRLFSQEGPVTFADPNQRQHDTAKSVFAEWLSELSEMVTSSLSARYDSHSLFDDAISYRAGLNWQLIRTATAYLSHGRAIKTPTFTEIFGFFPANFIGNPDLMPERNQEWELGVRFSPYHEWSGEVAIFRARLQQEILGFVFDPDSGNFTARNADGDSQRQGVEGSWQYRGDNLNARAHYTYLDATEPNIAGQQVELRRPRHQGSVSLGYQTDARRWDYYVKLAYTGTRFDNFFPPFPQPAETVALRPYTLISANVQYHLDQQWSLALRLDNALNQRFEDVVGFQGEQRRVLLNLSYR